MGGPAHDCFSHGGDLLSVDEAAALILRRVPLVATAEEVDLRDADGRIAADDIVSAMSLPPHDNSAVDGYAVRHADLGPHDTALPVAARIAAGETTGPLPPKTAARIFTGAPMPAGADTVFMQEDVRREGDIVHLPPGIARGANRRRAGEDAAPGDMIARAGERLSPQHLAFASALGRNRVAVRRPLIVSLLSTGSELVEPGRPLGSGRVYDSNRTLLATLLHRAGATVRDGGILPDDPDLVTRRLAESAAGADLVVTSGGVSVGEEDHVGAAIAAGGALAFWHLAVKPGRPVAMGMLGGTPIVGLPGNPIAAYVTFAFVVAPLLARLGGRTWRSPLSLRVPAAFTHRKKPGRREYLRVSLRTDEAGETTLAKFPREGSALLSSLTGSDGLAEVPEAVTEIVPGMPLRFFPHLALQDS
jgi:molybdopterin molybdotransferase